YCQRWLTKRGAMRSPCRHCPPLPRGLWVRGKHAWGRWADWHYAPVDEPGLRAVRAAAGRRVAAFRDACLARGEALCGDGLPLGFTLNDTVADVVRAHGYAVEFVTLPYFWQTVQLAAGSYDQGPQPPYRRLAGILGVYAKQQAISRGPADVPGDPPGGASVEARPSPEGASRAPDDGGGTSAQTQVDRGRAAGLPHDRREED